MSFAGVDAGDGGGMFPQHPKVTEFCTLKGKMMAPHLQQPLHSTAHTGVRYAPAGRTDWTGSIIVHTGMTPGGGTMAAK